MSFELFSQLLRGQVPDEEEFDERMGDEQLVDRRSKLILVGEQPAAKLAASFRGDRVHAARPSGASAIFDAHGETVALELCEQRIQNAVVDALLASGAG